MPVEMTPQSTTDLNFETLSASEAPNSFPGTYIFSAIEWETVIIPSFGMMTQFTSLRDSNFSVFLMSAPTLTSWRRFIALKTPQPIII